MTFNKNIFICWLQGEEHLNTHPKANLFNENLKNWQLLNPDWKVKLVSDAELRNACKAFSKECLALYDSFNLIHLKIDLGRYVMLYLYGGMYVDMDMYVLRSLKTSTKVQELLNKASKDIHVLGLSTLNLDYQESFMFIGRPTVINNAMMISTKKNPLLFLAIQTIISKSKKFTNVNSYSKIQHSTGPVFINKFFSKFIDHPLTKQFYIEIFPHYYFEPTPPRGYSDIREETIAIHRMELSWIPPHIKSSIKFYYKIKPLILPIVLPFVVIYLYKYLSHQK